MFAQAREIGADKQPGAFAIELRDARVERRAFESAGRPIEDRGQVLDGSAIRAECHQALAHLHRQRYPLLLEKLGEPVAFQLGHEHGRLRLAIRPGQNYYRDLAAQVAAGGAQGLDHRLHLGAALVPERGQFGTLGDLAVEHRLRLAEIAAQIGNAGVQHGGGRQPVQQIALIAQLGKVNPLEAGAQVGQQRVITIAVAAPGDVVLHRFGVHPRAGDGLIATVQHLFAAPLRHVHFALDHGNA